MFYTTEYASGGSDEYATLKEMVSSLARYAYEITEYSPEEIIRVGFGENNSHLSAAALRIINRDIQNEYDALVENGAEQESDASLRSWNNGRQL